VRVDLLVDGAGFWSRLAPDLAQGRNQILGQTLSFEGDRAGLGLGEALIASPAADRRVVIDEFTRHVMSDKWLFHPKHLFDQELKREVRSTREVLDRMRAAGVVVRFTNPAGWFYARFPIRNHKKLIAIDGRVAYFGGINFSDHNFAWHDLMVRVEDEAFTRFLIEDYEWTWRGFDQATARHFEGIEFHILGGHRNEAQFSLLLGCIDGARRRIFTQSPYITAPVSEALQRASARGVEVVIVAPSVNNFGLCRDHIHWKAATGGMDLRTYPRGMTHMKAMLIDDETLVLGSANFDLWSYRFQQEYLCFVTRQDVIAQFKEKIEAPDLVVAQPASPRRSFWGWLADRRLEWLERLTLVANGRSWDPSGR
jgi:cardiolipin synthase